MTTQQPEDIRDVFSHPRYASQMPAAFTKQYAVEQELEERRRAAEALRIANIQKVKDHVIGYGWTKACFALFKSMGYPLSTLVGFFASCHL